MKLTRSESGKLGNIKSAVWREERFNERLAEYGLHPTLCKNCKSTVSYIKRKSTFCSKSCSATFNNNTRSLKPYKLNNNISVKRNIATPVLISSSCLFCGTNKKGMLSREAKYCSLICHTSHKKQKRNEIIENGSFVNSGVMKRYLIEKHGSICMDPKCCWNFSLRPIGIELEHIDGNSENNTLENCILLCPNCHSQTATYKAKNKGNGRFSRQQRYAKGKSY